MENNLEVLRSKLSKEEIKQFEFNLMNDDGSTLEAYCEDPNRGDYLFADLISSAFVWGKTKQGHTYWEIISNR